MHRNNRVPHALLGGLLLLGLLYGGGAVSAQKAAEEVAPPPRPAAKGRPITVPVNSTYRLQMSNPKLIIEKVINEKDQIARVTPVEDDPTTIRLTGLQPGTTQLTVTSRADGALKPITEVFDIIVELDVALLRNLLARTVPTAAVTPVPGAGNTIIMTGTVAHAEDIDTILGIARSITGGAPGAAQIINAMRVGGVMQVQLDVVVARVSRSELRRFAFGDFGDSGDHHFLSSGTAGLFGVQSASLPVGNVGLPTITNALGTPNGAAPNLFLSIFNQRQSVFFMLQALRDNNLAKLLAEPHLVTLSGRSAHFNSGGQQAVPQVSGFGGTAGITFQEFGTNLDFLPIVLGNGKIYLEVSPSITALDPAAGVVIPGGGLVPGRLQQAVRTSVMMEDGQTFCIGGLIQNRSDGSTTKLPVLGDLPFIGALFSRKQFNEIEEEIVVLVTPHLVDPMSCDQVPRLLPGQETRNPDDFELFLEGILEAPRGQREVNHGRHYVPSWKVHPSAQCIPCNGGGPGNANPCTAVTLPGSIPSMVGQTGGGNGGCGSSGCANGNATYEQAAPLPPAQQGTMQPAAGMSQPSAIQPVSGPGAGLVPPGSERPVSPAPLQIPMGLEAPQ